LKIRRTITTHCFYFWRREGRTYTYEKEAIFEIGFEYKIIMVRK
jgi:hypothetical protein